MSEQRSYPEPALRTGEHPALEAELQSSVPTLQWRRAHFFSPIINAWLIIFVFFFTLGRDVIEGLFRGDGEMPDFSQTPDLPPFLQFVEIFGSLWILALFVIVFAVLLLPFYISWWFYTFAVDGRNVYVKSGVLNKTERKARLDRVQSIDINRSLFARLLGLAELKFDVADGSDSALAVKFLSYKDARALRAQLLSQVRALKTGGAEPHLTSDSDATPTVCVESAGEDSSLPAAEAHGGYHRREKLRRHVVENLGSGITDADEQEVVHVPVTRLLASMALSLLAIFSVVFLVVAVVFVVITGGDFMGILFANAALLFGVLSGLWMRFNNGYNFRLSISPDGLKTRYGFTNTLTQTLPAGRVQAVSVTQPLLWRKMGWYRVSVALVGKGEDPDDFFAGQLLPVGTYDDLQKVLPLVVPGAEVGGVDAGTLRAGLIGEGGEGGFITSPVRAKLFDPFTYKRNGFALLPALLLTRSGRVTRNLAIVPHCKIQNLDIRQGPLASRRSLASVWVETAGGASAVVHNADAAIARALLVREAQLSVLTDPYDPQN